MALYAFDGTWNEHRDTGLYGVNTNVVEFARAYAGTKAVVQKAEGDQPTVRDDFYVSGVGTRHGFLGRIFGGAFGFGGHRRIKEAKAAVAANFKRGDEAVDIVGFSRGAALALHFSNKLAGQSFPNQSGVKTPVRVRFLGLWDLVASFGIPIDLGPLQFQRLNLAYKLSLAEHVQYCFHAVALDERRGAFRVTRMDNGYQVWFRGGHSDVGGGNQNYRLSNIALAWMLRKAAAVGLPVNRGRADEMEVDASAPIARPGFGRLKGFRDVTKNDRLHYTVSPRDAEDCRKTPEGCPIESREDERTRVLTTRQLKEEATRARG